MGRGPAGTLRLRTRAAATVTETDFEVMPAAADAGADRLGARARQFIPRTIVKEHRAIEAYPDGIIDALGEGNLRRGGRDVDLALVSPGLVRTPGRIGEGGPDGRGGGVDVAHLRAVGDPEEGQRLERR